MVIILLNVVIALVSNSWDAAEEEGLLFFLKSRQELLLGNVFQYKIDDENDNGDDSSHGSYWSDDKNDFLLRLMVFVDLPVVNFLLGLISAGLLWHQDTRNFLFGISDPESESESESGEGDATGDKRADENANNQDDGKVEEEKKKEKNASKVSEMPDIAGATDRIIARLSTRKRYPVVGLNTGVRTMALLALTRQFGC
jgi:hypothetical protein